MSYQPTSEFRGVASREKTKLWRQNVSVAQRTRRTHDAKAEPPTSPSSRVTTHGCGRMSACHSPAPRPATMPEMIQKNSAGCGCWNVLLVNVLTTNADEPDAQAERRVLDLVADASRGSPRTAPWSRR